MDSPHLQSSALHPQRVRSISNLCPQPTTHGVIRKRTGDRPRSISPSHAERLHQLALDQATEVDPETFSSTWNLSWITPQHSPERQYDSTRPSVEPFPTWTVPTPPRSDSGVPTVCFDVNDDCASAGINHDFSIDQPTNSAEMSSLGFLLPSQYGSNIYDSEPNNYQMDTNYIPPMRMSQSATTSSAAAYSHTISSSPALYQSKPAHDPTASLRRHSEVPSNNAEHSYSHSYRRISNPYDVAHGSPYSMASGQTIPSISGLTQSPLPSPHVGGGLGSAAMSQYNTSLSRPPGMYDSGVYSQSYSSATPTPSALYSSTPNMTYPPPFVSSSSGVNEVLAKPLGSDASIRVLNQRPKPQCWEHGCNGRQFSTFSNLLRHQREKSGTASKSYCPKCGAEFTRTTARNGHLAHDKCSKQRQSSEDKS